MNVTNGIDIKDQHSEIKYLYEEVYNREQHKIGFEYQILFESYLSFQIIIPC